jgi:glutathione S-transferase
MKLYDSVGPNPRLVRMFIAEKGLTVPIQRIDVRAGENRQPEHLARNPHGQTPTLELDNGSFLSEITAICEYLEEMHPAPPLIGATAEERAECRMWTRRIDLYICEPMANGFRFSEGLSMFASRMLCVPEAAEGLKKIAADRIQWMNGQMAGKEFVCGSRFTLADLLLYGWLHFGAKVGQPMDPSNTTIADWYQRIDARPSAKA